MHRDHVTDTIVDIILPTITNSIEKHLQRTFDIQIPEYTPPIFDSAQSYGRIGVSAKVLYSITFEVSVVCLLADFSITEPLITAIDPWKDENDGTITLVDRAQSN